MHYVVLKWVRAERSGHLTTAIGSTAVASVARLLDQPNLDDAQENRARLRLLYLARVRFVVEVPPDTMWYRVENLEHKDLSEVYAVNYPAWTDPADNNELLKVGLRKQLPMTTTPSQWEEPILWGHEKTGPFTILEGNHRLAAYAGSGRTDLNIPILVGLSSMACVWHVFDQASVLLQDMIP
jgi:hypothetical protein